MVIKRICSWAESLTSLRRIRGPDDKLKGDSDSEKIVGVSGKMYVGKYFRSTGEFLESVFYNDIRDLIDLFKVKFSQGKFEVLEYNHKEHQD